MRARTETLPPLAMRVLRITSAAVACFAFAIFSGCGEAEIPVADAEVTPTTGEANEEAPVEPTSTNDDPGTPPKPTPRQRQARYRPPFPGRSELFFPPSNARRVARRNDGEFEESVELMGFVKIDEPHAVLAIDGVVTPVALGDERQGVQVISIQPPVAVLQRGRSRWTATLD